MNKILNIINYKSIQNQYLLNKEWIVEQIVENPTYYYIKLIEQLNTPYPQIQKIIIHLRRELNEELKTIMKIEYSGYLKGGKQIYEVHIDTIKEKEVFIEKSIQLITLKPLKTLTQNTPIFSF
jgi:hypothetical protein